ncbi:MAG: cupin domain-containing protein [Gammaproteobacteria bacterium]|nr:cupin domain-containing protein [Gammaproteobacteria bacterium]
MSVLGDLSPNQFLREYWQRQPLLVRNALPDYRSPVSPDELAGLALDADVESRLVMEHGDAGPWELRHGPFQDSDFLGLPERDWTLLVQAVDLWVPEVKLLLQQFDFLPPWRFDDIMVSYAVPGGSVGPHFDQYDVFLLQVEGERRWEIGESVDDKADLLPQSDLRILQRFKASRQWALAPGDMLYLPPRVSHWGVAVTGSLTYSVGFRSPTLSEMLGDLAVEVLARDDQLHYSDPPLNGAMASEEIASEFVKQARELLLRALDNDELLADWFARFMTAPKYPELEEDTGEQRRARINGVTYENGHRLK